MHYSPAKFFIEKGREGITAQASTRGVPRYSGASQVYIANCCSGTACYLTAQFVRNVQALCTKPSIRISVSNCNYHWVNIINAILYLQLEINSPRDK